MSFRIIAQSRFFNTTGRALLYSICFAFSIILQCGLFHYLAFHSIQVFTVFRDPGRFFSFYLPKIAISFAIASFSLFFKKKNWTILISFLLMIWIMAELIYYRVNGILIDAVSITIVSNMKGFWNGIFAFVYPQDLVLLAPTIFLAIVFYVIQPNQTSLAFGIILLSLSLLTHLYGATLIKESLEKQQWKDNDNQCRLIINPFLEKGKSSFWGFTDTDYVKRTSVVHCLFYDIICLVKMPFVSNDYHMTTQDIKETDRLFNGIKETVPNSNLYIILFESLETWAVSQTVTPAIQSFIDTHENILWAKRVIKQTRSGISGDGQMIINTGVLPISEGVTCFQYSSNVFPSLSEQYSNPAIIVPGDLGTWNQKRMSDAYGITTNYQIKSSLDANSFNLLVREYKNHPFVLTITIASHTPFVDCSNYSPIIFDQDIPDLLRNYLNCVHYTDDSLASFLSLVNSDETLKESTIVITGDHTIFDATQRQQFDGFCKGIINASPSLEAYCPLIVYSPAISKKTLIEEESYQMDIFPTILSIIGCEDYYFKGFGKNLLDDNAPRCYSEDQAFSLSNKLIRSNYFKSYLDSSINYTSQMKKDE